VVEGTKQKKDKKRAGGTKNVPGGVHSRQLLHQRIARWAVAARRVMARSLNGSIRVLPRKHQDKEILLIV